MMRVLAAIQDGIYTRFWCRWGHGGRDRIYLVPQPTGRRRWWVMCWWRP